MSESIVKWRRVAALRPDHLAETKRLLACASLRTTDTQLAPDDEKIRQLLWTVRALPLVVDVLTDARSAVRIENEIWRSVRVLYVDESLPSKPCWMAAVYRPASRVIHVAAFETHSTVPHPRPARARLRFELNEIVCSPMEVSIQRFRVP